MSTVRAASASPFTAVRDGERDAIYAELLSEGPAHPVAGRSGPIGWLITGHEEVRSLLSDPRLVKGGWRYGTYAARLPRELARGARIALGTLLTRYPRLRLDTGPGAVTRYPSMVMNGLNALPVHLR
ncbi:hypothetical protein [Streptosporangium sp. LJ11]|uniref:hypothetical protein n=1 Tax=Streptosporangium sp. LJ11 TaxID=3436927 RepID=UPI003F79E4AE